MIARKRNIDGRRHDAFSGDDGALYDEMEALGNNQAISDIPC